MFMRGSRRPLRALQIEVTSRCTRQCAICPRFALSGEWLEGDLSREHWRRLEQDLNTAQHVHLQGWGEPLLHVDLPRMVKAAKRNGCTVGISAPVHLRHRPVRLAGVLRAPR
jgi:MoaA/NifB/PqqE/SkfB family radical SAM enzyme